MSEDIDTVIVHIHDLQVGDQYHGSNYDGKRNSSRYEVTKAYKPQRCDVAIRDLVTGTEHEIQMDGHPYRDVFGGPSWIATQAEPEPEKTLVPAYIYTVLLSSAAGNWVSTQVIDGWELVSTTAYATSHVGLSSTSPTITHYVGVLMVRWEEF